MSHGSPHAGATSIGTTSYWRLSLIVAAAMLACHSPADARPKKNVQASAQEKVDPASIAALTKMGDYVASLPDLIFETRASTDIVAANGQTLEIGMSGRYIAKRPDKLRVDLTTDVQHRQYYYDGKTFTMLAPKEGYYGQVEAKSTIKDMLNSIAQTHAIELPLADLFDLGTPDSPVKNIRSGFFVGKATINGTDADHWAFRSKDKDWELWIRTGDKPLPLKFAVVNRKDPARPRYEATVTWDEGAGVPDNAFTFTPSADQKPIGFFTNDESSKEAQ